MVTDPIGVAIYLEKIMSDNEVLDACDHAEIEVLDARTSPDQAQPTAALAISTPLKALIDERNYKAQKITALADAIRDSSVINYFLEGYRQENTTRKHSKLGMFDANSGIVALDAECWARAIQLTDVLEMMPAAQRNEWSENIRELNVPPFEEETVMATILELLLKRESFFAQKVDGIFRALSGDHVTNAPEGFGKRMILAHMYESYGSPDYRKVALVHDLRTVIARILGKEEPSHTTTSKVFRTVERDGQWNFWDGGTIRIRSYKKGTSHLEIHPEIAWQLNKVLATLYPLAIPAQFRNKPAKPFKEYALRDDVLSPQVIGALDKVNVFYEPLTEQEQWERRQKLRANEPVRELQRMVSIQSKNWTSEVGHILQMIGGVKHPKVADWYVFDYNPEAVINEILMSGSIPDRKSFQFYPTPAILAEEVVKLAEITEVCNVLEPSAGSGGLARMLPSVQTTCVEISKLHCKALETMFFHEVVNTDFLSWNPEKVFERIVMNPPFSEGRAVAHVTKALSLLAPGGRLVAILPPSSKNQLKLDGYKASWSGMRDNLFDNTTVSVVILTVDKPLA